MKIDFKLEPLAFKQFFKYDFAAGISVFFVAVPLCLGIAHASGAPLIAGLISGIIGGVVIGFFSQSQLSVSGPAAGLTAIVLSGIQSLSSYEMFLAAVVLSGILQIVLGLLKTGAIAGYIPNTVIKGMLSAIGLILIIKQFPHLIGYDIEQMGVEEFNVNAYDTNENYHEAKDQETNTITIFIHALKNLHYGVLITGVASLFSLVVWDKVFQKKHPSFPGVLLVVIIGYLFSVMAKYVFGLPMLPSDHFVNIPKINNLTEFFHVTSFPTFSGFINPSVIKIAVTIALVASIETLLSLEAIEKLDPLKRNADNNQELIAQGIGNTLAGLLGGLPVTSVIVRGSVNVAAGAKTKLSSIYHGVFIMVAIMFLSSVINLIPLASLAAVLIYTGFKLLSPKVVIDQFKKGFSQYVPFVITVVAIVFTDLLVGVTIGLVVALSFIIYEDFIGTKVKLINQGTKMRLVLGENITFLHKPHILKVLAKIEPGMVLEVDGSGAYFVDKDIQELLLDFWRNAHVKNINVIFGGLKFMSDEMKKELEEEMKKSYERLFINNQKWVEDKTHYDPEYFSKLAKGQTPQYLFIGCSDSRVPANEITGTDPGEMFVHRNIANLVVNTDVNMLSVVQYSVEVLNVKHIIVCGHYGCGGVKAAMTNQSNGLIDKWLRNIKDVYRLHKPELDAITDLDLRHRRLVELNVYEQVINVLKTSFIQKNIKNYGFPQVHGWVYDIGNGKLIDLNVDIDNQFPEYRELYQIN